MGKRWRSGVAVVLWAALGCAAPAMAVEPLDCIKETTDRILAVLTDPELKAPDKAVERKKLIRQAVDERFDWFEMSRRTLARHWRGRTDEEKKEFIILFADLLERTYLDQVDDYSGEEVVYEGQRVEDDYALVSVLVTSQKAGEIPVLYRLRLKGETWRIYDLSIEGVSLVKNYRSQFNSIILRSSFQDLVKQLRAKRADG